MTDDAFAGAGADMLGKLEAAIDGGACAVQLRLKHAAAEEYVRWAWQVRPPRLRRADPDPSPRPNPNPNTNPQA